MKKILILSANPKNTANLRLDEEVGEIKNTLAISPHRDEFQIITESAVRVDDLTRFLFHHQPTIVHFLNKDATGQVVVNGFRQHLCQSVTDETSTSDTESISEGA